MAIKPTDTTISLVIDKEYYQEVVKPTAADQRISANELIRRAIEAYISEIPRDKRLAKITGAYSGLNDQGKAWLLECSQVAIGDTNLKA